MREARLEGVELSPRDVNLVRIRGQFLDPRAERAGLLKVVKATCGLNAQLYSAMVLSLRSRIRGIEWKDVSRALEEGRDVLRVWTLRGTIHLTATTDAHWLVSTLGPVFERRGKRRYRELGLSEDILSRSLFLIPEILDQTGPLTRWELMDELESRGLSIDRNGQAPIHLIRHTALNGLICLGPDSEVGETTYRTLERPSAGRRAGMGEMGLTSLAKRYVTAYGPATIHDLASWSGVSVSDAREAWKALEGDSDLTKVLVMGREMILTRAALSAASKSRKQLRAEPTVRLLPAFDSYVLGYADRGLIVSDEHYGKIYHGGQTVPVVLVDGSAAGVWRFNRRGKSTAVDIHPFEKLSSAIRDHVLDEAEDVARLFGSRLEVTLS